MLALLVLGWSLATAALALLSLLPPATRLTFALPLALRFLFGLFQAGGFPAISRALTDWMPTAERGTAQGLIWAPSRAGGAIAPLVAVPAAGGDRDWPASFLLLARWGPSGVPPSGRGSATGRNRRGGSTPPRVS